MRAEISSVQLSSSLADRAHALHRLIRTTKSDTQDDSGSREMFDLARQRLQSNETSRTQLELQKAQEENERLHQQLRQAKDAEMVAQSEVFKTTCSADVRDASLQGQIHALSKRALNQLRLDFDRQKDNLAAHAETIQELEEQCAAANTELHHAALDTDELFELRTYKEDTRDDLAKAQSQFFELEDLRKFKKAEMAANLNVPTPNQSQDNEHAPPHFSRSRPSDRATSFSNPPAAHAEDIGTTAYHLTHEPNSHSRPREYCRILAVRSRLTLCRRICGCRSNHGQRG